MYYIFVYVCMYKEGKLCWRMWSFSAFSFVIKLGSYGFYHPIIFFSQDKNRLRYNERLYCCLFIFYKYISLIPVIIGYHRYVLYSSEINVWGHLQIEFLLRTLSFFFLFPSITGSFPNELLMSCQLLMQIEKETDTEELIDMQLKYDTAWPLEVIKNVNCSNLITGLDPPGPSLFYFL